MLMLIVIVDMVNGYAVSKIESLEESYPVIVKPTDEVVSENLNIGNIFIVSFDHWLAHRLINTGLNRMESHSILWLQITLGDVGWCIVAGYMRDL